MLGHLIVRFKKKIALQGGYVLKTQNRFTVIVSAGKRYGFKNIVTPWTCACPLWFCVCYECARTLFIMATELDVTWYSVRLYLIMFLLHPQLDAP